MAKKLRTFCESNNLLTLSPDKGKGWVIVKKDFVEMRLKDFMKQNFEEVTKKTCSDDQYLAYRESRVRRAITRLRDAKGTKDPRSAPRPLRILKYVTQIPRPHA